MAYVAANIGVSDALKLLADRGACEPSQQLLAALRDGSVNAFGLVDGSRKEIHQSWWHHINCDLGDVVWFDDRNTNPPTPFRAERIDVLRKQLDQYWPELKDDTTSPKGPKTLAANQKRRGPPSTKRTTIEKQMRADLRSGDLTSAQLSGMKEEALRARYNASRDTVRKARQNVLNTTNTDK